MSKEAVLLLNMGGPSNLYEVDKFLTNMFNDPCILPIKNNFFRKIIANIIVSKRSEKSKSIYTAIGGKSPITEITFSLTQKLQSIDNTRVYSYAMRYAPPYTQAVLEDFQKQKIDSIILFSMYPQYSTTTSFSSLAEVHRRLKILDYKPVIKVIDRFYDSISFNKAIICDISHHMKTKNPAEFTLIFSAHGLPQSVIDKGDTYQKECERNVEILKDIIQKNNLNFGKIILSYQSKVGPAKWIGPSTEEIVRNCTTQGVIIYPLTFSIDNSETKYELCIQYKKLATQRGIKDYIVCPCLNDSDKFAKMIVEFVNQKKG
ncbi:ferrochelatase [Helicobacter sp. 11S03491-1]|uniref:ferrochelatase n=1 Tax=Helicobacter sp. 11S03491-1 TaxID=1476196 RepID=UPI000BA6D9BF|nr:ferrochelatase [Helicobacter sp. 11S03491-1]PAF43059.1 ferrochelatase [Helicobacter sp. 11S03491-1]